MSLSDELAFVDATTQAQLVRQKDLKPIELVNVSIERIEKLNPAINAVITPIYDEARAKAHEIEIDGPFAGVPFLLKDLISAYKGVRLTAASSFQVDFVPDHDSVLVSRLKRAGLIVIGKTNTPEYGLLPTTEPKLFGPTRNPWNNNFTAGGSSGGSAAAVAAGFVPMAHAGDGGGSLRVPASCCGLFGLKPTRARNPIGPDFGDIFSGLIAEHAITRSVRDSAALLDATSGPDVGDPYMAPQRSRPFLQDVGADPGQLRIAFTTKAPTGTVVHPDCVTAVNNAAELCAALGHEIVEASPTLNGESLVQAFLTVWAAGCTWTIDDIARTMGASPTPDKFEPLTWALYETGRQHGAATYLMAVRQLQAEARNIANFFRKYHLWLTPTLGEPPVPLGTFDSSPSQPTAGLARAVSFTPFAVLCNVTGQPAMSVPLFWNAEGLPIGVHFAGRFGDEATLFRLASQLESASPWMSRVPPIVPPQKGELPLLARPNEQL